MITGHPSRITNLCVYHPDTYLNEHGEDPVEGTEVRSARVGADNGKEGGDGESNSEDDEPSTVVKKR